MQTYFLSSEICLFIYVCYDVTIDLSFYHWGRLRKVEITTLGVGIGAKEREGEGMAVSTWPLREAKHLRTQRKRLQF